VERYGLLVGTASPGISVAIGAGNAGESIVARSCGLVPAFAACCPGVPQPNIWLISAHEIAYFVGNPLPRALGGAHGVVLLYYYDDIKKQVPGMRARSS
jgi:hypothetical protein